MIDLSFDCEKFSKYHIRLCAAMETPEWQAAREKKDYGKLVEIMSRLSSTVE